MLQDVDLIEKCWHKFVITTLRQAIGAVHETLTFCLVNQVGSHYNLFLVGTCKKLNRSYPVTSWIVEVEVAKFVILARIANTNQLLWLVFGWHYI